MDKQKTITVHDPEGKEFKVRLSSIIRVESCGVVARRYYLIYPTGRAKEVDRSSAEAVFDAIQPQLF